MKELVIFIILLIAATKLIDYFVPKFMNWLGNQIEAFGNFLGQKLNKIIRKSLNFLFQNNKISNEKTYEVDPEIMKRREKLFEAQNKEINSISPTSSNQYTKKELITDYESYFYNILLELENELDIRVQAQINLRTIIDKETSKTFANELFRNIDFGIFTKDCKRILLLIEIDDKTHQRKKRIERDKKVKDICTKAGIKLIKFHSNYPNEKQYVKNRIKKELNNSKEN